MSGLVVATFNVQETLCASDALLALGQVLERSPDVIGLQEWHLRRWPLLRAAGSVRPAPWVRLLRTSVEADFTWRAAPVGGCVIGIRQDRFELRSCTAHVLSWPGRADRCEGGLGVEAGRVAVVVRCRDRSSGRLVALIGYHLVHGVQLGVGYRPDRPRLVARHRREVSRLGGLVTRLREEGDEVIAFGDSNYHGFRLPCLVSAWSKSGGGPGTLGRRRVDDVHAPTPPRSINVIKTRSDHDAVVVQYAGSATTRPTR
jgi:hypothetical protein